MSKHKYWMRWLLACASLFCFESLQAKEVTTVEEAFLICKTTYAADHEAKKRHACFDSIGTPNTIDSPEPSTTTLDKTVSSPVVAVESERADQSYLERKWRLTSEGDWDISDFETYKTNYLLVTNTDNANDTPSSPSQLNNTDRNLDKQDVKFQISLKTELMSNIPLISKLPYVTSSRLWAAYTQQSYWQMFNRGDSRPFRENNYEPELILSLGIDNQVNGEKQRFIPRMLNVGMVHQSNGRNNPFSRSWNRAYLQGGWEVSNQLTLMVRPWWRIPDERGRDDNPDIEKYMGYGDMSLRWEDSKRKTAATILLRNNLRQENKGFVQFDVQRQVFRDRNINLHFMMSSGYGETLLDYNHSQNVVGLGISLGE